MLHTEGDAEGVVSGGIHDNFDTLSALSESVIEREGVTRNPRLILPEADDDAFFDNQSQKLNSSYY